MEWGGKRVCQMSSRSSSRRIHHIIVAIFISHMKYSSSDILKINIIVLLVNDDGEQHDAKITNSHFCIASIQIIWLFWSILGLMAKSSPPSSIPTASWQHQPVKIHRPGCFGDSRCVCPTRKRKYFFFPLHFYFSESSAKSSYKCVTMTTWNKSPDIISVWNIYFHCYKWGQVMMGTRKILTLSLFFIKYFWLLSCSGNTHHHLILMNILLMM